MLLRIAWHEIREAWRSRVLLALGTTVAVLVLGAAIVGVARHAADDAQRARFQDLVAEQWQTQPDRHPHRVAHYGFLVFRPRAPLGFFDTGLESFTGSTIFLEAHRQNSANFSEAAQADGTRQFGELTTAMVVQLLVPLLIFAVAGITITREREHGTLWLLLCQGASWTTILWGKLTGTLATILCLVAPGTLLAGAWLAVRHDAWNGDAVVRAGLLAGAHMLYLFACAALAVLVSAAHRTSRGAIITLVALWIGLWILVPRALPGVATALYPLPSRAAFEATVERTVRELGDSHNPNDPNFQALRARTLAEHGVDRVEDLPVNYNGIVMTAGERLTTEAYRAHLAELGRAYEAHARLVAWTGLVSPFVAMRSVSMALAGVDAPHAREFDRQAEDYRYTMTQRLNELHTHEVAHAQDRYLGGAEGGAPSRQRITRDHFETIAPFTFTPPRVAWAVMHQRAGLLTLGGWTALLALGIVVTGRRPVTL
jgi:ABC-2 type transport system permease protein